MKKLYITLISAITFFSCSKEKYTEHPSCQFYSIYADQCTWNDSLLQVKLIIDHNEVCNKEGAMYLDSVYAAQKYNTINFWIHEWDPATCPPPDPSRPLFRKEHYRYVIGNEVSYPLIFKP